MNDFSGIVYRIWGVGAILLLVGSVCLLIKKPWSVKFRIVNCKFELFTIAFSVCFMIIYLFKIIFPNISFYTGEFISTHRNSMAAPPLPLTFEYVFWNGDGEKKVFYLDVLSEKNIMPDDFEIGKEYTVYFDKSSKVITRIE